MRKVVIRHARPSDGAGFLRLVHALAEFEKLPGPTPVAEKRLLQHAFEPRPKFELLVAEDGEELVAYTVFFETYSTFLAKPILFVEDIFVLPQHRGRGIATALLACCARIACQRDCGRMEWAVLDWNEGARQMYEHLGARPLTNWIPYRFEEEQLAGISQRFDPALFDIRIESKG